MDNAFLKGNRIKHMNKSLLKKISTTFFLSVGICAASSNAFATGAQLNVYYGQVRSSTDNGRLFVDQYSISPLIGDHEKNDMTFGLGAAFSVRPSFLIRDYSRIISFESLSIGIDAYQFDTSRKGKVLVNGEPQFANYKYEMHILSRRALLDGQLNFNIFEYGWIIFAQAGAGEAWNNIAYHDTPMPGIGGNGLRLPDKTTGHFAYDLGGGIKFPLAKNLQISARYLYSNLGTMKSSTNGNFFIDEPIKVKLTAQSILLGLTYIVE